MRLRVAFGALTMAAGLFAACDEADGDPSAAAGSAGFAGSSAIAGAGGDAGVGGSTVQGGGAGVSGCGNSGVSPVCSPGTAGSTNTAGDAGITDADAGDAAPSDASDAPSEPCTGCLELRATVTTNDESAFFQIVYDTHVDLSAAGATITFRVSGLSPESQVRVEPFAYDADFTFATGDTTELVATDGFSNLVLELDDITDVQFDKSDVFYVGLLVGYTGGIGAESSQDLAVLLDSVTFSGAETPDLAFTTDNESFDRTDDIGVQATQVVHR